MQAGQDLLAIAVDDHQQVVGNVGDAGGEPLDRLAAMAFVLRGLAGATFGDVDGEAPQRGALHQGVVAEPEQAALRRANAVVERFVRAHARPVEIEALAGLQVGRKDVARARGFLSGVGTPQDRGSGFLIGSQMTGSRRSGHHHDLLDSVARPAAGGSQGQRDVLARPRLGRERFRGFSFLDGRGNRRSQTRSIDVIGQALPPELRGLYADYAAKFAIHRDERTCRLKHGDCHRQCREKILIVSAFRFYQCEQARDFIRFPMFNIALHGRPLDRKSLKSINVISLRHSFGIAPGP